MVILQGLLMNMILFIVGFGGLCLILKIIGFFDNDTPDPPNESRSDEYYNVLNELNDLKKTYVFLLEQYNNLNKEKNTLQESIQSLRSLLSDKDNKLSNLQNDVDVVLQENTSLKMENHSLNEELDSLKAQQKVDPLYTYSDLMEDAGVPHGVTFDRYLLPHYYCNSTVEKNMHVYISDSGKCYHRKFLCSGASTPVHLFTVADRLSPCSKCIPRIAWHYRVPAWYYRYLKLLGTASNLGSNKRSDEKFQLKEPTEDGISELMKD